MKRPSEHAQGDTVDTGSAFWVGAILLVGAVVMHFALALFFREMKQERGPIAGTRPPAPGVALEIDRGLELQRVRQAEDQALSHYEWANREQGRVRIPIERAIELLVEKGKPDAH